MKTKKYILIILIAIAFFTLININKKTYATDLDEIEEFNITVDPRMNDGSLDITYEVKWKVLDSVTEGPLEWVQIGTPNQNFSNATALSTNIRSISQYNGSYVKIVFNKKYQAGETAEFKYSIHQEYMYKISGSKCKYEFTPAWFTDIKVDKIKIRWNSDQVKKSNANTKEDNYLVWTKENLAKGEKINTKITYKKSAFSYLDEAKQRRGAASISSIVIVICIILVVFFVISFVGMSFGDGYYGHRGFYYPPYYGYHHHHHHHPPHHGGGRGGCASGGGCASSCACACACAGSGRAGCSKKDFYGTNLRTEKIKEALK